MTRRLGWASAQRRKLLVSLAVISAAASIAGLGTFATFTSSTSASQSVSSGTVTIALGATGASTNRLTVGASNIAPGDTIQRSVDLIDSGTIDLASITLTTNATTSSLLDTDATNGLQMVIDRCSNAWTEGGTAPAYTYLLRRDVDRPREPRDRRHEPGAEQPVGPDERRHGSPPRHAVLPVGSAELVPEPVVDHPVHVHRHAARRHEQVGR